MAEGHFPDFESAFDAAPMGQERQVRIGCCSVIQVDSEDPQGPGLAWSDLANGRFMDNTYAQRMMPEAEILEGGSCFRFSKWLVFQGFHFDLPNLKTIKDIQFALRGHTVFPSLCSCCGELYNWAATRGGILYPLVPDAFPQVCIQTEPIGPNPPYYLVKGHAAALGDLPGSGEDCSTDEVYCIQVSNWCPPDDLDYGLFFTQDGWNTNHIDSAFGIAIQVGTNCLCDGGSGSAYIDCCGVAIYYEP
jgi:hypothetical protein